MPRQFDFTHFRALIEEKAFDQARALLKDFFSKEPSDLEKGEFYVKATSAYLDLMNAINQRQLDVLKEGIVALQDLDSFSQKVHDDISLRKVKKKMKDV